MVPDPYKRFDPFGFGDRAGASEDDECGTTEGGCPPEWPGGRTMTCQHEGDIQKLLLECSGLGTRVTSLEVRMTAFEEQSRIQAEAKRLVQAGKSDEQVAADRRRNIALAVAMLLMPVFTALLNKLWK